MVELLSPFEDFSRRSHDTRIDDCNEFANRPRSDGDLPHRGRGDCRASTASRTRRCGTDHPSPQMTPRLGEATKLVAAAIRAYRQG
jgi:hypothetical protein